MFGQLKLILIGITLLGATGGVAYVYKLKADNAILKENQIKLEEAVNEQQQVIAQQKQDFESILQANKELNKLNATLNEEVKRLDDKFNKTNASGKKRDIGDLANTKPKLIEKIINRATINANRCVEIAMGSPLTEKELNATKNSEINSECPSIANPSYVPY
jgi:predicted nuclease with TOPRIM domain